ncbi:unnamed protein product [Clonostachys rosea f. rosea IK726]|uniref:Major facilitator superfamily (MFS) profile domain-containing protein n=2 Tax=Bionectria ochroleuca TaxID=29856 RepID=A0A0B7KFU6_BIOOC|nr:unnamed protein product [Clonostachys rosea f. rosea IK726]
MTSSNDPMETEPKEKKLGNIRLHDGETKQIILIPKPTSDPNDPLNWSKAYRIYIACLVSCAIFFSNFLAAGPSVAMVAITTDYFGPPTDPRFAQWTAKAAYLFTSTALLQGMGNLFWVPMMVKFGRRPVYVISFTIYTAVSAWAGAEASFDRALAARILMGFASGAAECLAPLTIADIFFLHERGTVMAFYTAALSAGVGTGIVVSGLITINLHWRYIYWISTALIGTCTILIIFTFPETTYDRSEETEPAYCEREVGHKDANNTECVEWASGATHSTTTKNGYWQSLRIFSGRHTKESYFKLAMRPVVMLALPPVLWATIVMAVTIGFLVAITSNFAIAFNKVYGFEAWQAGLCFLASPIGALIGAYFGGHLTDQIADRATHRNGGIREPEMRLPAMTISVLTSPLSLVLYGVGIGNGMHWMVPTLGLGLLSFSVVQATNITLVYTIDVYRPIAGEITVTQHAFKSALGFLLSFYTNPWIEKAGYQKSFGAMAGISGGFILFWVPFYLWGNHIRKATWRWNFVKELAHWHDDREVGE